MVVRAALMERIVIDSRSITLVVCGVTVVGDEA
jgi:hypothetical protein